MQIKDVVSQLRQQLEALDQERRDGNKLPLFNLSAVEVELSFVVKDSEDGKVGFDIKVISAGMGANQATESVQKMKIVLSPAESDASDPRLGTRFQRRRSEIPFEPLE